MIFGLTDSPAMVLGCGRRPGWGFSDHFGHVFSAALPIVGTDADLDPTDIDGCRERWGLGGPCWSQRVAPCEGLVNSPSSEECIQIEPAVE